jgi:hypothetical protein
MESWSVIIEENSPSCVAKSIRREFFTGFYYHSYKNIKINKKYPRFIYRHRSS